MTDEQAALCVQAYWRRYLSVIYYQESRGAAITVQAAFRGTRSRQDISQKAEAAAKMQARMRGNFTREVTDYELVEFRAAAALQAVWRRHLACALACRLRWEKQGKLKRTFSWSRQKKQRPPKPGGRSLVPMSPRGSNPTPGKPVKRSSSFDRFTRGRGSAPGATPRQEKEKEAGAAPAPQQTFSKQLLFILLSRGPNGLGLELDATNTVINVVKGAAADVQGYFRVGDTIASVDGIPLRGRLLQEVMEPGKSSYSFDVWRLTRPDPTPAPVDNSRGPRRALSFDRKRR